MKTITCNELILRAWINIGDRFDYMDKEGHIGAILGCRAPMAQDHAACSYEKISFTEKESSLMISLGRRNCTFKMSIYCLFVCCPFEDTHPL